MDLSKIFRLLTMEAKVEWGMGWGNQGGNVGASSWFSHDNESQYCRRETESTREIKTCDDLFHKGQTVSRENP